MGAKHDKVAATLTDEILHGRYRTGDRLPSERELALRFNVSRGAVREAMSRLSQLGVAVIQPGGARAAPLREASLDIIGHLLASTRVPDAKLLQQIFQVIEHLLSMAAEAVVDRANDTELQAVRVQVLKVLDESLDEAGHAEQRIEMMRSFMLTSDNLVGQLIAHSLFQQFAPSLAAVKPYLYMDIIQFNALARQLEQALAKRNRTAVRRIFDGIFELHRITLKPALRAAARQTAPLAAEAGATP